MITVKLIGGLGNQLFQYNYARFLACQLDTTIRLDLIELQRDDVKTHTNRHYSLDVFPNIQVSSEESRLTRILNHRNRLIRRLGRIYNPPGFKYIKQHGLIMPCLTLDGSKDYYLDGYFVNHNHVENMRSEIMADLSNPLIINEQFYDMKQQIRETSNAVFIHARRGDYFAQALAQQFGICTAVYYKKAMVESQRYISSTCNYFVFSDDIAWAKSNLDLPSGTVFVSDGVLAPHEELLLMSVCKHGIICNSTFSWWGAWLIANDEKVIVTPSQWMGTQSMPHNIDDIVPSNWIKVPVT